jgi:hypothetical protein
MDVESGALREFLCWQYCRDDRSTRDIEVGILRQHRPSRQRTAICEISCLHVADLAFAITITRNGVTEP